MPAFSAGMTPKREPKSVKRVESKPNLSQSSAKLDQVKKPSDSNLFSSTVVQSQNVGCQNPTQRVQRKPSFDNKTHEIIEHQKLASIAAFQTQKVACEQNQSGANKRKSEEKPPSVAKMMRQVKSDSKMEASDWQREYEERKKKALEALNRSKK